jgi:hypothetical protein
MSERGSIALLLWAYGITAHHGRSERQRRPLHLTVAENVKEKQEWAGVPISLQGHNPNDLTSSH